MKVLNLSVSGLFLITLAFISFECGNSRESKGQNNEKSDMAAIEQVLRNYEAASRAGDFDSWIALWADNGIQMPSGFPPRVGKAEITVAMKPLFTGNVADMNITSIEEVRVFGNVGLSRCSYNVAKTPIGGGDKIVIEPNGKALTIYQRQGDGSWKIIYDCFNSNLSPGK
jgi:uncharacterized protein (TIGR02246 family)